MCRNIEAVADARAAGANVQTAACRRQMPDGTTASCPHFENCAFQAQRHRTADLWFVAHELPYSQKPGAIGKLALLVVDEAPWAAGLRLDPVTLPLDALGVLDQRPGDEQSANWAVLQHHRSRAADALRGLTDGPLIGEAFELTAAEAAEARALEWARKQHVDMIPGMPAAARKAALKAAESNRTIARLALFWTALEALLCDGGPRESGWAALATESTEAGPVRVLALTGRKPVREGWQVPTLLLDATMNIDLVRPFWPQVELTADVATKAPWQRIRQVGDFSYSKRRLAPAPDAAPADQRRRARNLRSLHATLAAYARRFAPGRVLVVAQKAVEEALPTVGPLPTGVELAHHNAVAGRDEWGPAPHRAGVRALVVVGRTLPPPADVERMAEALTGRAVTPLPGWYPRIAATRETTGGAVSAEADRHPDPIAEAIRWQICEGELLQIIGRGRGVNRTEVDPVEVLVLTDAVLPLLVDQLLASADLAPGPVELMLSAGGVALDCAADAARAYPTLWPSHAAVKKAFRRSEGDNSELEFLLYGNVPLWTLKRARYQRAGARQPRVALTFDPDLVPDLRAWLEERLGALASYEIEGAPAPAQLRPAPAPPPPPQDHTARLRALSIRLEAASPAARLATLVARLEAVRPRPPPPWRRSPPARPPAPQLVAA
jgi:putative DNA primase/helicase